MAVGARGLQFVRFYGSNRAFSAGSFADVNFLCFGERFFHRHNALYSLSCPRYQHTCTRVQSRFPDALCCELRKGDKITAQNLYIHLYRFSNVSLKYLCTTRRTRFASLCNMQMLHTSTCVKNTCKDNSGNRESNARGQRPDEKERKLEGGESVKENLQSKLKDLKEDISTVPNLLTMSRIVFSPVIGYLILQENFSWATGLLVCAGISDLLDGYIARNFVNQKSVLGSFLDPLADKFLISIVFVTLTMVHLIPVPLTALILLRDVSLILAAFYVRHISLSPPRTLARFFDVTHVTAKLKPTFISKVNTLIQLSLVAVTLPAPIFAYVDHPYLQGLWYLTAGTTVLSGVSYILSKNTYEIIKKTSEGGAPKSGKPPK